MEIVKATARDKAEVVDFINYVFSQAHRPHDFKTLIPKSYADHVEGLGGEHYMVVDEGKIRALIADRVIRIDVGGEVLKMGLIGQVSVHPYERGSGYMKKLLSLAIDEARAFGVDFMMLGGQRQRYGYFGFEKGGYRYVFSINRSNVRHCLAEEDAAGITFRDLTEERPAEIDVACALYGRRPMHAIRPRKEFLDILHNWNFPARAVYDGDRMVGYVVGHFAETVLEDERMLPRVLKAAFAAFGYENVDIAVAGWDLPRVGVLSAICENYRLEHMENVTVLNWQRTLQAFLRLRASFVPLAAGSVTFSVDGGTYRVTVEDHVPTVERVTDPDAPVFGHTEAIRTLFGLGGAVTPDPRFYNWLPLPVFLDSGDMY